MVWAVGGLLWDGTLGSGEGAAGCLYASNEFDELETSLSPDSHGHYYIKSVFPTLNPLSPTSKPPITITAPHPSRPSIPNPETPPLQYYVHRSPYLFAHIAHISPPCVCQKPLGSDLGTYGGGCGIGYDGGDGDGDGGGGGGDDDGGDGNGGGGGGGGGGDEEEEKEEKEEEAAAEAEAEAEQPPPPPSLLPSSSSSSSPSISPPSLRAKNHKTTKPQNQKTKEKKKGRT